MSDKPEVFKAKTEAMFSRTRQQITRIAQEFIINAAGDLIVATPGYDNQYSPEARYVPTGRLRGGWTWSESKISTTVRYRGGPYSLEGGAALEAIADEVRASPIVAVSYLNNDVAYNYIVHEGLGFFEPYPRPYVTKTARPANQKQWAAAARRKVMGR